MFYIEPNLILIDIIVSKANIECVFKPVEEIL